jgi:rhodanese-related sulfurtransferase
MKIVYAGIKVLITLVAVAAFGTAFGQVPVELTAEEAFDAVQGQFDPMTGEDADVVLVDVRDPLEYFSSGAAAAVTEIVLSGANGCLDGTHVPDVGKVQLQPGGGNVRYWLGGDEQLVPVQCIDSLGLEPIAVNVPYWRLTESGFKVNAKNFYPAIQKLARDYDVVILFCRTGGRSSRAGIGVIERGIFPEDRVYEIDDPYDPTPNRGGFSGPTYDNVYNGYAGFPGRLLAPVSWLDSGLPILTTTFPAP